MHKAVLSYALRWNNAIKQTHFFRTEILANKQAILDKIVQATPYIEQMVKEKKIFSYVLDSANLLLQTLPLLNNETLTYREQNYKDKAQGCFDSISEIRKNALCTICSNRVADNYDGNVLRVQHKTCDNLLRDCYTTFRYMLTVMGTVRPIFDVLNSLDKAASYPAPFDPFPAKSKFQI